MSAASAKQYGLALDPNLTGGQILEYFAHLRGGVDQSYLKQLVQRFDLDTSRKFRQYSTGNKRKVVLIQAFMHRPRLLMSCGGQAITTHIIVPSRPTCAVQCGQRRR